MITQKVIDLKWEGDVLLALVETKNPVQDEHGYVTFTTDRKWKRVVENVEKEDGEENNNGNG